MKKLFLILFCFMAMFNITQARYNKIILDRIELMEDVPWMLEYSYNKYGEKDKIIAAECGQWSMKNRIKVKPDGVLISFEAPWSKLETVEQISFLFDSKTEIIMTDVEEQEYDGVKIGKAFFISKSDKNYKKLINKMKTSNYMSILMEDTEGNIERIVKVKNTDSYKVLTAFENSLK